MTVSSLSRLLHDLPHSNVNASQGLEKLRYAVTVDGIPSTHEGMV